MDIKTANAAAQAYTSARSATKPDMQNPSSDHGFQKLAGQFAETLAAGENQAKSAMFGTADPHALVQALATTELAVETAVTVRDKVVEAYQEILRMPV